MLCTVGVNIAGLDFVLLSLLFSHPLSLSLSPLFIADSVCLANYLGTGNIAVYSLPSLKPLIDIDFLPLVDVRYDYCSISYCVQPERAYVQYVRSRRTEVAT